MGDRVVARRAVFDRYVAAFSKIDGIEFMPELEGTLHNRWLTTLTVDQEKLGVSPMDLINALAEENIEARPVWKPLHLQPLFEGVKYYTHEEGRSVSDELFENGVCLPSGSNMTDEQQQRVIDKILDVVNSRLGIF